MDAKYCTKNVLKSSAYSSHSPGKHHRSYVESPTDKSSMRILDNNDEAFSQQDFDFHQYRVSLNRIFFNSRGVIIKDSQEYHNFWSFLDKFKSFQKKKQRSKDNKKQKNQKKDYPNDHGSAFFNVPIKYDHKHRINMSFFCRNAVDFIKNGRLVDYNVQDGLTPDRVKEFYDILLHYFDFCQKNKFEKLRKVRDDQKRLPIFLYKEKIVSTIQENQVVVVAGDTGCGKSTQVPQYLLEAGFDRIACTQPRTIACISLAKRVGYETFNEYGSKVAFQVRFEKTKTSNTKILFLTEGLLLRQMLSDQFLKQYSIVVLDEVHERHLFTDFLLGVMQCLLKSRADLKLVLMSATINIHLFSTYFHGAPVIKVPGRLYPVEVEYRPFNKQVEMYSNDSHKLDPTPYIRIMQRIDTAYPPTEHGDLLIFMSGLTEIMTVVEAARTYAQQMKRWIVLPLHGALSVEDQEKAFDYPPEGIRKCIVSTNIAETSVTIDGIRFVVDSGKVKEMSFDPTCRMRRLKEFWISKASAEQRKGRAGRTGPGVCFRLYAESDYDELQAYMTPEILRVPLNSLILQIMSMGLPDIAWFPFIEAPDMSSVEGSICTLKEQGALDGDGSLTAMGEMLSMLPVDVVIGKMLIVGSVFLMVEPVITVAAALSVQSPFTSKAFLHRDAISARRNLESCHGDPLTLLNAFNEWIQMKSGRGRGTRQWCRSRCLEEQRFYEMTKLKRQFTELLTDHHLLDYGGVSRQSHTSEQRRHQHGERKRLGDLKRQHRNEEKRRKVLTLDEEDFVVSDGEEDKRSDIKDLEFRLSHDLGQLRERSSRSFTPRDINILKVILCSGIYPQMALADSCNTYKLDSEQVFHTKSKSFVFLHPTSVFSTNPELLRPRHDESAVERPIDMTGQLKAGHELIAYGSLLETNSKPYLVNCLRVPALQTVTLFSTSIDTNVNHTRLVCDGWLEFRFPDTDAADRTLSCVIGLRSLWQSLVDLRLEYTFNRTDCEPEASSGARGKERILSEKLAEFLEINTVYTLRRILSAEVGHLYVGPGRHDARAGLAQSENAEDVTEHPVKGGVRINSYLTYNCLLDDSAAGVWSQHTEHMHRHWKCPQCQTSMLVTVSERLLHEDRCQWHGDGLSGPNEVEGSTEEGSAKLRNLTKCCPFFCSLCDKSYNNFTATDILRHKRSHCSA